MLRVAGLAVHGSCTETSHTVFAAREMILVGLSSLPELIGLSCRNTQSQNWQQYRQRESSNRQVAQWISACAKECFAANVRPNGDDSSVQPTYNDSKDGMAY